MNLKSNNRAMVGKGIENNIKSLIADATVGICKVLYLCSL